MINTLRIIGKLLLIGLLTTMVRIIGQLIIPAGSQNVLGPSIFVENGTMPIAFLIYGIFAYSIIASLFLLVKDGINGNRLIRGLKYSLSCCFVWIVYLLEPLPHVAFIDKFTYPLADSAALIVMGILSGFILCKKTTSHSRGKFCIKILSTLAITLCFVAGRMVQYLAIDIYSSFDSERVYSIIWAVAVGLVLSVVLQWYNHALCVSNSFARVIVTGAVLFGFDLILFNFFMPLVFKADIADLIIRTCMDLGSATIGCLSLLNNERME